jgi:superfamily II DNA or RNA helicase
LHYQNRQFFLENKIENVKYDIIVLDEFHRTGAKTYEPKIKALLANNPNAFILGATATPIRTDGRNMNDEFDFEYASDISLPKAIVKEYIPNPTYVASLIDLEEEIEYLKKCLDNSKNPVINKESELENLEKIKLDWKKSNGVDAIFKKYLSNSVLRNFIVFCEDIETLRKYKHKVSDWFIEAGFKDSVPFIVHSNQSDKENDEAILNFTKFSNPNKTALLFAVDMFNEGLHIKNVDGVILLRKTTSHIVFYQQIGRCLQVGSKNPIIFDLVNNFSSVEASNFLKQLNIERENEQRLLVETRALLVIAGEN